MKNQEEQKLVESFLRLVEIVKALREPETGCPWDIKQTHKTLASYLVEESFEAIEAIESGTKAELCDELGDVILQVIMHSVIGEEEDTFSLCDVLNTQCDKIVERHPHVFGDNTNNNLSLEEVEKQWQKIKNKKKEKSEKTLLDIINALPKKLPAFVQAQRLIERAHYNEIPLKLEIKNSSSQKAKLGKKIFELARELEENNCSAEEAFREFVSESQG